MMKHNFKIIILLFIITSCTSKDRIEEKTKQSIIKDTVNLDTEGGYEENEAEKIEREKYFGFDTLLLQEYVSKSGHKIRVEGSQSGGIYRVSVKTKDGKKKKFIITENSYMASHSSIVWDNENYIFIHYGCGTSCVGGLILCLNDERGIIDYQGYIYDNDIDNMIVYPDSINSNQIVIENFNSKDRTAIQLDLCEKSVIPMEMIEKVERKGEILRINYLSKDCKTRKTKEVNLKSILN